MQPPPSLSDTPAMPGPTDQPDRPDAGASSPAATPETAAFQAWLGRVAAQPHRFDFYQVLRHIESAHPQLPRLGQAARPADEPLRIGQPAELTFAPAPLHALRLDRDTPQLLQRIFGLLGPNGPLPIHLTELVRERSQHNADATLQQFLDMLTHRFALLFYRAWAQAQPVLGLDRPGDDAFTRRLGALVGVGSAPLMGRDAAGDAAKLHFAGRLGRQVRDADGLLAWCHSEFDVPLRIAPWCGHWMPLDRGERSRLSRRRGHGLGQGAVLGGSVWDVQHKFRIVIGPLALARYQQFLPGGADLARLQAIVRQWVGLEFEWDVQLILARAQVPRLRLGTGLAQGAAPCAPGTPATPTGLGRSAWLGRYQRPHDAADLCIDVERTLRRRAPTPPTSP